MANCSDRLDRAVHESIMKAPPPVYLQHLAGNYPVLVCEGLEHVDFFESVPSGSRVFLKPNLTLPTY